MSIITDITINRLGAALTGGTAFSPISVIALGGYAQWNGGAYQSSDYTPGLTTASTALVHEFETATDMENIQRRTITPTKSGNTFTIPTQSYETQVHTVDTASALVRTWVKELGVFSSDDALLSCDSDPSLAAAVGFEVSGSLANVGREAAEQKVIYNSISVSISLTVRRLA